MHRWSITEAQRALSAKEVSAEDITTYFLERISRLDPQIGAFVHVDKERAAAEAKRIDQLISEGHPVSPGWGIPTADKDLVRRAGMPTGFGSASRATGVVETESDPMALWLDEIGAISVGKTTTSEFGLAGYTEPASSGATKNPHHLDHTAGGSSGGAAAAVAAGLLPFAPGSDGGGSIRIPALSCGVAGWKPSRGLIPSGSGFEHLGHLSVPGLLTRTLADMAALAPLLTHGSLPYATRAPEATTTPITRVGVTVSHPWPNDWGVGPGPESDKALQMVVQGLVAQGIEVSWCDWEPETSYAEHFFTLWAVSAAGIPVDSADEGSLEPLTQYLRRKGQQMTAVDLSYALSQLKQFERNTISAFEPWDVVITPGLAFPAPPLGWFDQEHPENNFRQQVRFTPWTSFVNVSGLPAIAIPTGVTDEGLPMGVQVIGKPGADLALIDFGARIEKELGLGVPWPVIAHQ